MENQSLESWDRRLREIVHGTSVGKVTPIAAVRVVAIMSKPGVNEIIRLAWIASPVQLGSQSICAKALLASRRCMVE